MEARTQDPCAEESRSRPEFHGSLPPRHRPSREAAGPPSRLPPLAATRSWPCGRCGRGPSELSPHQGGTGGRSAGDRVCDALACAISRWWFPTDQLARGRGTGGLAPRRHRRRSGHLPGCPGQPSEEGGFSRPRRHRGRDMGGVGTGSSGGRIPSWRARKDPSGQGDHRTHETRSEPLAKLPGVRGRASRNFGTVTSRLRRVAIVVTARMTATGSVWTTTPRKGS